METELSLMNKKKFPGEWVNFSNEEYYHDWDGVTVSNLFVLIYIKSNCMELNFLLVLHYLNSNSGDWPWRTSISPCQRKKLFKEMVCERRH